ncbi:MAG: hypothetical protein JW959_14210 [Pirellulales bacterium]|nr:hypothetical protein [Pirellulales bacterium]
MSYSLRPVIVAISILSAYASVSLAVEYPGPEPGEARAAIRSNAMSLENNALGVQWSLEDGRLGRNGVEDKQSKVKTPRGGELFILILSDGRTILASELTVVGEPLVESFAADMESTRAGDRIAGKRIDAKLTDKDNTLSVGWQAELRDGANYVRETIAIEPQGEDLPLKEIVTLFMPSSGARRVGAVLGSPVVSGNLFFACESPVADNQGDKGQVRCRLTERRRAAAGESFACRSVIGVAPPGQMRRAFLRYVERQRPRPYRPFLHYNCFYDISAGGRKFDEIESLAAIHEYGRALVEKRGVEFDAAVFDDGWDDNRTLWDFHAGFPRGFTPLRDAAAKYNFALGAWLSPWGGYGKPKNQRLLYGRKQGYETNAGGFFLGGPKYYARFRRVCLDMMEKYGVRYFKFDGMGVGIIQPHEQYRTPTRAQLDDTEAMLRLLDDLRRARPDVYLSVTTGTWPSPFWLWHGDSIWRNGNDMDYIGEGTMRQRWINYRDAVTRELVAERAPLYPLNSLMTQGITCARRSNASRMTNELKDFKDEMRMFFASGTQLQELYITPQMMTDVMWDNLAETAKWSRANADVLVDTHLIGGDPDKGEVYGYASWSPRKGVVALRNPSGKPAAYALDLAKALELPPDAPREYSLKSPWKEDAGRAAILVSADRPRQFNLQPFQALVFDVFPGAERAEADARPALPWWIVRPNQVAAKIEHWAEKYPDRVSLQAEKTYEGNTAYAVTIADKKSGADKLKILFSQPHAHEPAATAGMMDFISQVLDGKGLDGRPTKLPRDELLGRFVLTFIPQGNPDGAGRSPEEFWDGKKHPVNEFLFFAFGREQNGRRFQRVSRWTLAEQQPALIGIVYEQINYREFVEPNRDADSTYFKLVRRILAERDYDLMVDLHQTEFRGSKYNALAVLPYSQKSLPEPIRAANLRVGRAMIDAWRGMGAVPVPEPTPLNYGEEQLQYFRRCWSDIYNRTPCAIVEAQNNNVRTPPRKQLEIVEASLIASIEAMLSR